MTTYSITTNPHKLKGLTPPFGSCLKYTHHACAKQAEKRVPSISSDDLSKTEIVEIETSEPAVTKIVARIRRHIGEYNTVFVLLPLAKEKYLVITV